MNDHTSLSALDSLKRAMFAAVDRYRSMSKVEFIEALVALCNEAHVQKDTSKTMAELMTELAAAGSIEAVAALAAMGSADEIVVEAIESVVARSEDLREGAALEGLTALVEEWLEEEVAAGRMLATIDPATGKKLYSSKDT
jgi:hypothetical protein